MSPHMTQCHVWGFCYLSLISFFGFTYCFVPHSSLYFSLANSFKLSSSSSRHSFTSTSNNLSLPELKLAPKWVCSFSLSPVPAFYGW